MAQKSGHRGSAIVSRFYRRNLLFHCIEQVHFRLKFIIKLFIFERNNILKFSKCFCIVDDNSIRQCWLVPRHSGPVLSGGSLQRGITKLPFLGLDPPPSSPQFDLKSEQSWDFSSYCLLWWWWCILVTPDCVYWRQSEKLGSEKRWGKRAIQVGLLHFDAKSGRIFYYSTWRNKKPTNWNKSLHSGHWKVFLQNPHKIMHQ